MNKEQFKKQLTDARILTLKSISISLEMMEPWMSKQTVWKELLLEAKNLEYWARVQDLNETHKQLLEVYARYDKLKEMEENE